MPYNFRVLITALLASTLLTACQLDNDSSESASSDSEAPNNSDPISISGSISSQQDLTGETVTVRQLDSGQSVSAEISEDGSFQFDIPHDSNLEQPLELTAQVNHMTYKMLTDTVDMLARQSDRLRASQLNRSESDENQSSIRLPSINSQTTAAFAIIDKNHDGVLDEQELNESHQSTLSAESQPSLEQLAIAMQVVDSDSSALYYQNSYELLTILQQEEDVKSSFFARNGASVVAAKIELFPEFGLDENPEVDDFLRLNNNAWPLETQSGNYSDEPWACIDDVRRVSSSKYGVRLWQTSDDISQYSSLEMTERVASVNTAGLCQRTQWRLPTQSEFEKLFKEGDVSYPLSFPFLSAEASYWVTDDDGKPTVVSINNTPEESSGRIILHSFEAVEMWRNIPPVETEVDLTELRNSYTQSPEYWPAPTVDKGVQWNELGLLPPVPFPEDNPYSAEKVALGKTLFFDTRLSKDNSVACSTCHSPDKGWADGIRLAIGIGGQTGPRNSPTIINTAYYDTLFLDGRVSSLEEQSLHPISNPVEMGLPHDELLDKLSAVTEYEPLFEAAFGDSKVSLERIAQAIATFERTIISQESDFDRFLKGDSDALSDQQLHGLHLYRTKARCMNCHSGPLMTNNDFENIGLTYYGRSLEDRGRFNATLKSEDMGKFRVPALRDIKATDPGTHTGLFDVARVSSSGRVSGLLAMYNNGMTRNRNGSFPQYKYKYDKQFPVVSPLIKRLEMTSDELIALDAFMSAITADIREDSATPEEMGLTVQ